MGFFDCLPSCIRTRRRTVTRRSTEQPKNSVGSRSIKDLTGRSHNFSSGDKNSTRLIPFCRSPRQVKSECSTQTTAVISLREESSLNHSLELDVPPTASRTTVTTEDDLSSLFLTADPLSEKWKRKRQGDGVRRAQFLLEQVEQCKEIERVFRGDRFREDNGLEWSSSSTSYDHSVV